MNLEYKTFQEIQEWVYCNARNIDLKVWRYHFENGSINDVLDALIIYQNEDGGFGKALEPDNWNPNSTPYTTLYAINILKELNFFDMSHPIYIGIKKYLASEQDSTSDWWRFNIASNDLFPHAPWWNYNEEANAYEGIGLSAELAAFIIEYFDKDTTIYRKATQMVSKIIDKLMNIDEHGDMGIGGYVILIDKLRELNLTMFDLDRAQEKVRKLVKSSIEYDISKWGNYGVRPSRYIISPDSIYYMENKKIVHEELEYLIKSKPDDDVWGITWTWFDNNEKYAKEFAVSENWWKAIHGISKLIFLRNFGMIEITNDKYE